MPGVDASEATLDRERSNEVPVEEITKDRVSLSQEALEGVEKTGCLGDSTRGERRHHVRAERGEEIGITRRRARRVGAPVRIPFRRERRQRASERGLEIGSRHVGDRYGT